MNVFFLEKTVLVGTYTGALIPGSPPIPSLLEGSSFEFNLNLSLNGTTLKSATDLYYTWFHPTKVSIIPPTDHLTLPDPLTRNIQYYDCMQAMWTSAVYSVSEPLVTPIPLATVTIVDTSFVANTIMFSGFPSWGSGSPTQEEVIVSQINIILNGLSFPTIGRTYPFSSATDGSTGTIVLTDAPFFV